MKFEKKKFGQFNNNYYYIFLDESGNSSKKMWSKVKAEMISKGWSSREYSTVTYSGIFVKNSNQFKYLERDVFLAKRNILGFTKNSFIHRTDLKNCLYLSQNKISFSQTSNFNFKMVDLAIKHKLPVFSA
ncbi:hypothetical protein [Spiroplasma alleghenense]|uniref:DUF3800 domain-containing protein n=1 Tax=Spiroplasma alleghenense TaxID=216931 RepID=A0A345Z550_9MOLU|nr:hypothetical protein [Spiroplasma alleghenense]AXK51729.1 hypothetical protein SALLE_v1c10590 [Spiroplasma alleghenense]